jgi:membrane protein YdbS with pleckstrin-like domain
VSHVPECVLEEGRLSVGAGEGGADAAARRGVGHGASLQLSADGIGDNADMNCPHCRAPLKDEHPRFCAACGKAIPEEPSASSPKPQGGEEVFFEGHPAALPSLGSLLLAIVTLGVAWLVFFMRSRRTTYRLTSQRIVVEQGLFSKRLEQVDLYRIVDYVVERPFLQRIMGTGNVTFETLDKTSPEVRIQGIATDVVGLYERLRTATEQAKRQRGVQLVDMEHQ